MQGTAVQTDVIDRGRIARQIISGRKIMHEILEIGGWMDLDPNPAQQEMIINLIQANTRVTTVGNNLVQISYTHTDPELAFKVTKGLAELFITGSLIEKANESESAFNFIDKQVKEYEEKLRASEEALKTFRAQNVDFREGAEASVMHRISEYRSQIDAIEQQIREERIKKSSLQAQLSGETETAAGLSRAEQLRSRIAELQSNLNTLRLSYHETYPDIIQIKNQISELRETLADEEEKRKQAKKAGSLYIDENIRANPVYQRLQNDLYQTNTLIATLEYRLQNLKKSLSEELERDRRINAADATLKNLTRDYNVTHDVYQDLLRRRENARVSMSLDQEHQGLTLRIHEPAYFPHSPSGPRFLHFIIGGIIVGLAPPIGLFFGVQQIMPRVYDATDIDAYSDIPVLGELSSFVTSKEQLAIKKEGYVLSALVISVFIIIIITGYLRLTGE